MELDLPADGRDQPAEFNALKDEVQKYYAPQDFDRFYVYYAVELKNGLQIQWAFSTRRFSIACTVRPVNVEGLSATIC